jgi:hypothetical protein
MKGGRRMQGEIEALLAVLVRENSRIKDQCKQEWVKCKRNASVDARETNNN